MSLTMQTTITLNNGVKIPQLGYGTALIDDDESVTKQAILTALEIGYRNIDTAMIYNNETAVGKAVKESGIPRDRLFITSKLWTTDMRQDRQYEAFQETLDRLDMDYVDLYMIHWPVADKIIETWSVLEKIYREGRVRAIGVSNFNNHHIEKILERCDIAPAVNQCECHPKFASFEIRNYCRDHQIAFEAYYPLGQGTYTEDPVILDIAQAHGKTSAQVLLRWHLQNNTICIPKSARKERMLENCNLFDFELSGDDIARIDALDINERRCPADPDHVDF